MATTTLPPTDRTPKVRSKPSASRSIFDPAIVRPASADSLRKLDPRTLMKNPVMFIVEVGALVTTLLAIRDWGDSTGTQNAFAALVAAWLWFTVLFANFAEAMAEGRTNEDLSFRKKDYFPELAQACNRQFDLFRKYQKKATRRVETLVMTLLIFFCAWSLLAFALAVPVGRLCAVKSSR